MTTSSVNNLQSSSFLYEQDYHNWLEKTAKILRNGDLAELDVMNLAEEIEDMGRSERRAVESNLEIVLIHLLKYQYQPEQRSNSWRFTILEHRDRLEKSFRDSPSLQTYFAAIFTDCYKSARKKAAVNTGLSLERFPAASPFTPEETLNSDFLPEASSLFGVFQ